MLTILNPKLLLHFLAFLSQFVPATTAHSTFDMTIRALAFMGMTFVALLGYGAVAVATRRCVISKTTVMAWIKRGFAAAFTALGARVTLADR